MILFKFLSLSPAQTSFTQFHSMSLIRRQAREGRRCSSSACVTDSPPFQLALGQFLNNNYSDLTTISNLKGNEYSKHKPCSFIKHVTFQVSVSHFLKCRRSPKKLHRNFDKLVMIIITFHNTCFEISKNKRTSYSFVEHFTSNSSLKFISKSMLCDNFRFTGEKNSVRMLGLPMFFSLIVLPKDFQFDPCRLPASNIVHSV